MGFQAAAGGGVCRHCRMRLPEWDTRDHCDTCLQECWEADHGRHDSDDEPAEDDDE